MAWAVVICLGGFGLSFRSSEVFLGVEGFRFAGAFESVAGGRGWIKL